MPSKVPDGTIERALLYLATLRVANDLKNPNLAPAIRQELLDSLAGLGD